MSLLTPSEFRAWREGRGGHSDVADELGLSASTIQRYEAGTLPVPLSVSLACRYLALVSLLRGVLPP